MASWRWPLRRTHVPLLLVLVLLAFDRRHPTHLFKDPITFILVFLEMMMVQKQAHDAAAPR